MLFENVSSPAFRTASVNKLQRKTPARAASASKTSPGPGVISAAQSITSEAGKTNRESVLSYEEVSWVSVAVSCNLSYPSYCASWPWDAQA